MQCPWWCCLWYELHATLAAAAHYLADCEAVHCADSRSEGQCVHGEQSVILRAVPAHRPCMHMQHAVLTATLSSSQWAAVAASGCCVFVT